MGGVCSLTKGGGVNEVSSAKFRVLTAVCMMDQDDSESGTTTFAGKIL